MAKVKFSPNHGKSDKRSKKKKAPVQRDSESESGSESSSENTLNTTIAKRMKWLEKHIEHDESIKGKMTILLADDSQKTIVFEIVAIAKNLSSILYRDSAGSAHPSLESLAGEVGKKKNLRECTHLKVYANSDLSGPREWVLFNRVVGYAPLKDWPSAKKTVIFEPSILEKLDDEEGLDDDIPSDSDKDDFVKKRKRKGSKKASLDTETSDVDKPILEMKGNAQKIVKNARTLNQIIQHKVIFIYLMLTQSTLGCTRCSQDY